MRSLSFFVFLLACTFTQISNGQITICEGSQFIIVENVAGCEIDDGGNTVLLENVNGTDFYLFNGFNLDAVLELTCDGNTTDILIEPVGSCQSLVGLELQTRCNNNNLLFFPSEPNSGNLVSLINNGNTILPSHPVDQSIVNFTIPSNFCGQTTLYQTSGDAVQNNVIQNTPSIFLDDAACIENHQSTIPVCETGFSNNGTIEAVDITSFELPNSYEILPFSDSNCNNALTTVTVADNDFVSYKVRNTSSNCISENCNQVEIDLLQQTELAEASSTVCYSDSEFILNAQGGEPALELDEFNSSAGSEFVSINEDNSAFILDITQVELNAIANIEFSNINGCESSYGQTLVLTINRPNIDFFSDESLNSPITGVCEDVQYYTQVCGVSPSVFNNSADLPVNVVADGSGFSIQLDSDVADVVSLLYTVDSNGCSNQNILLVSPAPALVTNPLPVACGTDDAYVLQAEVGEPILLSTSAGNFVSSDLGTFNLDITSINDDSIQLNSLTNDFGCNSNLSGTIIIERPETSIVVDVACAGSEFELELGAMDSLCISEAALDFFENDCFVPQEEPYTLTIPDTVNEVTEYIVSAISENGCSSVADTLTINPAPTVNSLVNTMCAQETIELEPFNNVQGVNYLSSGGMDYSLIDGFFSVVNPDPNSFSTTDVVDIVVEPIALSGCAQQTENATVSITVNPHPQLGSFENDMICEGNPLNYIFGENASTLFWEPEEESILAVPFDPNPIEVPYSEYYFDLNAADIWLANSFGCETIGILDLFIRENPQVDATTVNLGGGLGQSICSGDDVFASIANIPPVGDNLSYSWSTTLSGEFSSTTNATFIIEGLSDNDVGEEYSVSLEVIANHGGLLCPSDYTGTISVSGERCQVQLYSFPEGVFVAELSEPTQPSSEDFGPVFEWETLRDGIAVPMVADGNIAILNDIGLASDTTTVTASFHDTTSKCPCELSFVKSLEVDTDEIVVSIFPNPLVNTRNLSVLLPNYFNEEDVVIELFDANGRLVYEQQRDKTLQLIQLELPWSLSGVYALRVHSSNHFASHKIIIR